MKLLHQVHIAILVVFFILAIYHLEWVEFARMSQDLIPSSWSTWDGPEQPVRSIWTFEDQYTRRAAMWAGVTLLMTTLVGYWTRASFQFIGVSFMGLGVLGMGWKAMMYHSPSHISLEEVMPAWILYILLGIGMSAAVVIGLPKKEVVPLGSEDDLLDDQWGSLTN